MPMTRRKLIQTITLGGAGIPLSGLATGTLAQLAKPVRLGVIADLHVDLIHDAGARLDLFLKEMVRSKPDGLLQLGDFAFAKKENQKFVDQFNKANEVSLHVIGNHDTDGGLSTQDCLDSWGIKSPYYHHEAGGLHLVVLDANEKGSPTHKGGYPQFVGKVQADWLRETLAEIKGPVLIISHQPIAGPSPIDNAAEIQKILSEHADKIVLAINGHTHIDHLLEVGGVQYLHLNSASYHWLGSKFAHESYPPAIHAKHPALKFTSPYRDALFTTLTFDPAKRSITVAKRKTSWVGESPRELGLKREPADAVTPEIRERTIQG